MRNDINIIVRSTLLLACGCVWLLTAQEMCPLPHDSLSVFNEALAAKDAGENERAVELMGEVIDEFEGSPAPYYILGNWYWESGKQEEALLMWQKARYASPG